jgi:O-methyltransferase
MNSIQYKFHVLVPLWNPEYIEGARKFLFSSILAPGNLSPDIPINLHVIGKQSEASLISGCPEWQRLSSLCNATVDGLPDSIFDGMSYFAMSHCYDHALSKYESPESVFVFLTGDIVLAQNTFSFLRSLLDQGYRAATVPGPRVHQDSVEHFRRPDGVLVATGRDLMRAMWEKPLALTKGYEVMSNGRNKCPMHYYWRVGQYSTLARNTMMHPLMVWPDNTAARVVCPPIGANAASAALDQGYMRHAIAHAESIYIGDDSDKLAVVSISSDDHFSNDIMIEEGYTLEQEKGIFSAFCNDYHFWYGAHDLFLKGEEFDPGVWVPTQQKAAATIKTKMDYAFGLITVDPTISSPSVAPAAPEPTHRRHLRRLFSGMRKVRDRIADLPYIRSVYRKGIRFLFPVLGRLETRVESLAFQLNNSQLQATHLTALKQTLDDVGGQTADLAKRMARIEKRFVSIESGMQTIMLTLNARIARLEPGGIASLEQIDALRQELALMPSADTLHASQKFLTEVFSSYRWLGNRDPESITSRVPLGHHSALRARHIYKDNFYVLVDYLISNQVFGPVLEFGSRSGFTSRCLAEVMAERNYPDKLYLFDSFEGLPEITSEVDLGTPEVSEQKVWFKGAMAMPPDTTELISNDLRTFMQPHQFEIVKGYFADTLQTSLPTEPPAMVHIDCDLYQSTAEVLETLNERKLLQNGMVLMFDDFNTSKADPRMGERRALAELLQRNKALSVSPFLTYNWHGQAFVLHVAD